MLQCYQPRLIHAYIVQHEKPLDYFSIMKMEADAVRARTKVRIDERVQKPFRTLPWESSDSPNSSNKS